MDSATLGSALMLGQSVLFSFVCSLATRRSGLPPPKSSYTTLSLCLLTSLSIYHQVYLFPHFARNRLNSFFSCQGPDHKDSASKPRGAADSGPDGTALLVQRQNISPIPSEP